MSLVVNGKKYHENSRDTQEALSLVANRLQQSVEQLGLRETVDPRLTGIGRQLNTLTARIDLSEASPGRLAVEIARAVRAELADSRTQRTPAERYESLTSLHQAVKIARHEASPFDYSAERKDEIRTNLAREFSFARTERGATFQLAAGENIRDTTLRLHTLARDLDNGIPALSSETLHTLMRSAGTTAEQAERISFGRPVPNSYRKSFTEHQSLLSSAGTSLPEQSRLLLAHTLQYAITGSSMFQGYPVRISENRAARFGMKGLEFVLDGRADRFSAALGMKAERL